MNTLKSALRANAASCIVFSLIFLLKPTEVAMFLGGDTPAPETLLQALGAVLMANGLHLVWASRMPRPSKHLVLYFSSGDFIWAIASISLVLLGVWVTTAAGIVVSMLVSVMVVVFGLLQMVKRKNMGDC